MKDISLVRMLPKEPTVPFINMRMIAAALSVIAIIASLVLFSVRGLNYGIDFTGGTVIELDFGESPRPDAIREALTELGFGGGTVQNIAPPATEGKTYDFVRVGIPLQSEAGEGGQTAQQDALKAVEDGLRASVGEFEIYSQDVVGSKVSGELRTKGALAVGLALFMVLAYIWFRSMIR